MCFPVTYGPTAMLDLVDGMARFLQNGQILGRHFQPHESHIPFLLQFKVITILMSEKQQSLESTQHVTMLHYLENLFRFADSHLFVISTCPVSDILSHHVCKYYLGWLWLSTAPKSLARLLIWIGIGPTVISRHISSKCLCWAALDENCMWPVIWSLVCCIC